MKQTYGLSELGILSTKSKANDSLWMKVGGDGFETQVREGTLWIKARSAMLGYLNAPAAFDSEGWFETGDRVEVEGEYLKVLGRNSDVINVGGEKVFPAEVESVLLSMDGVVDAAVYGESNPLMGQIVAAKVTLRLTEDLTAFKRRLGQHCQGRLARYKVPIRVTLVTQTSMSPRFKKVRRPEPEP